MAEHSLIACIDIGTTGCRTIIFSRTGEPLSQAYEEYRSIFLSPTWIDHDPGTWLRASKRTLKEAAARFTGTTDDLAAIAVTSQRATFTPVDARGRPLGHAMLWQDKRAVSQTQAIAKSCGREYIYRRTGLRLDPYFSLPKLCWLAQHQPDNFRRAYKFLAVHDLILHQLTGRFVTDWTQASRTMLFNIERLAWDPDICARFGIPIEKLPESVAPGTVVGHLKPSLARELDLPARIPVVAAGGDQQAAAVGLGVVGRGLMAVNSGSGSFVLAHSDRPAFDSQQRVLCTASAVAGSWLVEAGIFTTGAVYRWFRDTLAAAEKDQAGASGADVYEFLNREAARSLPGSEGILWVPHFAGSAAPHWNPDAKGLLFGLSLGHTRASVLRALLEGLALEIGKNVRIIEDLIGGIDEIRVSGGVTRSELFNRIQADVYGKPVLRQVSEQASALGAMVLAATSVGLYPDLPSAVRRIIVFDHGNRWRPDPNNQKIYQRMSALAAAIYQALHEGAIYESLATLLRERGMNASLAEPAEY